MKIDVIFITGLHNSLISYTFPCYASGAEQEWKLAQSNMEAASSGLVSATNELRMASDKAKSASGENLLSF